jgi:DNA-binding XRE family transcriptional regulator
MSDPLRLHPLGEHAALVRDRLTALTSAELVVMTPEDLAELIKRRCGNRRLSPHPRPRQERVPIGVVDRLIARENPVRMWREHRGHSLRQLAKRAGVGSGYLWQIENGERKGTVGMLKKIVAARDVDDLT